MASEALNGTHLLQHIMDWYWRRIKRIDNRLKGLNIVLHWKARFRCVVGHLVFDFELNLVDYIIVIKRLIWVVIMREGLGFAS